MFKKYGNTRFNPTCTGDMHLGHAYLCLVNEYEAHSSGAEFFVRFDDTLTEWKHIDSSPAEMKRYGERTLEDLDWLGIKVDDYVFQSDIQEKAHDQIRTIYGMEFKPPKVAYDQIAIVKGFNCVPYPYVSEITAEKVWMDFMMHCDYIIRGNDLVTEFALYCYWVEKFRIPRSYHQYIPRLTVPDTGDISYPMSPNVAVCKTHGSLTVREFKEAGYSPGTILALLRMACLEDPCGMWSVGNVKENPVWDPEKMNDHTS